MPFLHTVMSRRIIAGNMNRTADSRNGAALIVALWVVIFLSMIVGFFAFDMHIEARITSYYRKRLKADYLARAGIERAKMLLAVSQRDKNKFKDESYEHKDASWFINARVLAAGGAINNMVDTLDTGKVTTSIVPEPALRNINELLKSQDRKSLNSIFDVAGIPEQLRDELIDCMLDWYDADDAPRPLGAESDYYESLDPPYRAKNGPLFTVDELLLVKGFIPQMLYGGSVSRDDKEDGSTPSMSGIADLLTTYGSSKVNINAASFRVLMTLPGMDEKVADKIIQERQANFEKDEEDHTFKNAGDLQTRVPGLSPDAYGLIDWSSPSIYRITSVGDCHGVRRQISCVLQVSQQTGGVKILRWLESDAT